MTDHSLKPWMLHRILFWWPGSDTPICFKSLKEMGKEKKNEWLSLFLWDWDGDKGRNNYQALVQKASFPSAPPTMLTFPLEGRNF